MTGSENRENVLILKYHTFNYMISGVFVSYYYMIYNILESTQGIENQWNNHHNIDIKIYNQEVLK
jgi:hypothetical protein